MGLMNFGKELINKHINCTFKITLQVRKHILYSLNTLIKSFIPITLYQVIIDAMFFKCVFMIAV